MPRKTLFHYLVTRCGQMVAIAHAHSAQHARKMADNGGFDACIIYFNDPAKGYCKSVSLMPRLEIFREA